MHVIFSMAGHFAETIKIPIGMYGASKYALSALNVELRHEIKDAGLDIKVTVRIVRSVSQESLGFRETYRICQYNVRTVKRKN